MFRSFMGPKKREDAELRDAEAVKPAVDPAVQRGISAEAAQRAKNVVPEASSEWTGPTSEEDDVREQMEEGLPESQD